MARRVAPSVSNSLESLAPLPLDADHWRAVFKAMRLSPRHGRVVELLLRDFTREQIAVIMGIDKSTLNTHLERISARTGTRGRMQLAMHVLAVSHQVSGHGKRRLKD